jgi:Family of unknown function (DUF5317)
MLLPVPALLALAAALLRGGSLRHLAALPFRGSTFIFTSLAIQVLVYMPFVRTSPLVLHWGGLIYIVALGFALAGALRNWSLGTPVRMATLGLAFNAIVITANGGYMPTNVAAMHAVHRDAKAHEVASQQLYSNTRPAGASTRLRVLSDVIPINSPGGLGNVYSIGDLLIAAGGAALVYSATRRPYAG